MHGWITCRAGVIPGNAGDVIGNEIGARGGVGVRAVGIQCLKWRVYCVGTILGTARPTACVPSVA